MAGDDSGKKRDGRSDDSRSWRYVKKYDEAGFGLVRRIEFDIIEEKLPLRRRPRAITLMSAIRSMHSESSIAAIGVEDFRRYGYGRQGAGEGLGDLVDIGLLKLRYKGGRTGRGHKSKFSIVHTRGSKKNSSTILDAVDAPHGDNRQGTGTLSDNNERKSRPFISKKAGNSAQKGPNCQPVGEEKDSVAGSTKEVPVPVEQEQGTGTSSCASSASSTAADVRQTDEKCGAVEQHEKENRVTEFRKCMKRIALLAEKLCKNSHEFIDECPGSDFPSRRAVADFLASKYERGEFSLRQIRAWIAENSDSLMKGSEANGSNETEASERKEGDETVPFDVSVEHA